MDEQMIANSTNPEALQALIANSNDPRVKQLATQRLLMLNKTQTPPDFSSRLKTALSGPDAGQDLIQKAFTGSPSIDVGEALKSLIPSRDLLDAISPPASKLREEQQRLDSVAQDPNRSGFMRDLSNLRSGAYGAYAGLQEAGNDAINSVGNYFFGSDKNKPQVTPMAPQYPPVEALFGNPQQGAQGFSRNTNLGQMANLPEAPQRGQYQNIDMSGFNDLLNGAAPKEFSAEDAKRNTMANLMMGLGAGISNIGQANDIGDIFANIGGNMLQARANAMHQNQKASQNYQEAMQKFKLLSAEGKLTEAKNVANIANKNLDVDYENATGVYERDVQEAARRESQVLNATAQGITIQSVNDKGERIVSQIANPTQQLIASGTAGRGGQSSKIELLKGLSQSDPNYGIAYSIGVLGPDKWAQIVGGEETLEDISKTAMKAGDPFLHDETTRQQVINNAMIAGVMNVMFNSGPARQTYFQMLQGGPQ